MSKKAKLARKFRLGNLLKFYDFEIGEYTGIIVNTDEYHITIMDKNGRLKSLTHYKASKGKVISKPYKRNRNEKITKYKTPCK